MDTAAVAGWISYSAKQLIELDTKKIWDGNPAGTTNSDYFRG